MPNEPAASPPPGVPELIGRSAPTSKSKDQLLDEALERESRDRSYSHRRLVSVFVEQQRHDRTLREDYARKLIRVLIAQVVVINAIVLLIGWGKRIGFEIDPWTARAFVVAVFIEICAFVAIVARYLFTSSADKVLDVIDRFRELDRSEAERARRRDRD